MHTSDTSFGLPSLRCCCKSPETRSSAEERGATFAVRSPPSCSSLELDYSRMTGRIDGGVYREQRPRAGLLNWIGSLNNSTRLRSRRNPLTHSHNSQHTPAPMGPPTRSTNRTPHHRLGSRRRPIPALLWRTRHAVRRVGSISSSSVKQQRFRRSQRGRFVGPRRRRQRVAV